MFCSHFYHSTDWSNTYLRTTSLQFRFSKKATKNWWNIPVDLMFTISFSSSNTQFYESRIFCLFTFWVFSLDKSFKLISKYTQKCQYNFLYWKEKNTLCNTLNWGNWNSGFVILGVRWAERDTYFLLFRDELSYLPDSLVTKTRVAFSM